MNEPWPKRPDGTNKRFAEMTAEEQRAQIAAAVGRIMRELESPEIRVMLAELARDIKKGE